jgi:GntR family transcriptional repressor for pyruvate dehydrogenase complex
MVIPNFPHNTFLAAVAEDKRHTDGQTNDGANLNKRSGQPKKAERVYEHIALQVEHAILQRRLRRGDKLSSERDLAVEFGVSRVVVREALRTLQVKGLLEVRKGATGGYFVKHADSEVLREGLRTMVIMGDCTVAHLAELRLAMEPEVARMAAVRATAADKQAIKELLEKRASVSAAGGKVVMLDLEFHRLVAVASRNPLYLSLLDSIVTLERDLVIPVNVFKEEDRRRVDADHRDIFAAILARDAERASNAMRNHILDLGERKA